MARRGGRVRTVYRNIRSKARRPRRKDGMRVLKKAAIGTAAGMAVSATLTYAGKATNQPILQELGQRGGSIVSTYFGGTPGNAGYQAADALFDRFVQVPGVGNISGGSQVYL